LRHSESEYVLDHMGQTKKDFNETDSLLSLTKNNFSLPPGSTFFVNDNMETDAKEM
jgi:hypothetical protein